MQVGTLLQSSFLEIRILGARLLAAFVRIQVFFLLTILKKWHHNVPAVVEYHMPWPSSIGSARVHVLTTSNGPEDATGDG